MTLMRIFLLAVFLFAPFVCFGKERQEEPFWKSSEFREMLSYAFAQELYWNPPPFYDYAFHCNDDGRNYSAWRLYPLLGKKISGVIKRSGEDYKFTLKDESFLLNRFCAHRIKESKKYRLKYFYGFDDKNAETVCENYEFTAPTDFISVASKFGPGTEPLIEKVKKELERLVEDVAPGWNHFFVGPFRAYMFPCGLRIYWLERKMIINWSVSGDDLKIDNFNLFPLEEETFKDGTELSSIGNALQKRMDNENVVIANCVRDGRLIAIEKKDTETPEDKAWASEGFRKAVTYLFAYHMHWHPEDIARNKSGAPTAWKIKGKIYKQKNKFKVEIAKPVPLTLLVRHNKDGSWSNTEWEDRIPEKLVCGSYELEIPSDIRGTASTFDKDHAGDIDVIAKALTEKHGYALEKCHFFIGPFRKYMLPYRRSIYIYWLEGNRFLFPYGDEKRVSSFETICLDDNAPLTPKYTGRSFEENLRLVKERLAKKATGMDTAISNCINDGIMISFEPNCCKMPPVEIVDKPGAEEKK